jgi:hypothetical protein
LSVDLNLESLPELEEDGDELCAGDGDDSREGGGE